MKSIKKTTVIRILCAAVLALGIVLCQQHAAAESVGSIASIVPATMTLTDMPQLRLALVRGDSTHFAFMHSKLSLESNNDSAKVIFSLPLSPTALIAFMIIRPDTTPGIYTVSVGTDNEIAYGIGLFEIKNKSGASAQRWEGDQKLTVVYNSASKEIPLAGLPVVQYNSTACVRLSDIVNKSALTAKPEKCWYDFISADGFKTSQRLLAKDLHDGLPYGTEMEKGYIYDGGSTSGMTFYWEDDTLAMRTGYGAYKPRNMQGGQIIILDANIN